MINYKCDLVNELDKILPTYYEMFVDSSIKSPCITYIEMDNSAEQEGDTIAYSSLSYRIKIWADSLAELTQYAEQLVLCVLWALRELQRMNYGITQKVSLFSTIEHWHQRIFNKGDCLLWLVF